MEQELKEIEKEFEGIDTGELIESLPDGGYFYKDHEDIWHYKVAVIFNHSQEEGESFRKFIIRYIYNLREIFDYEEIRRMESRLENSKKKREKERVKRK